MRHAPPLTLPSRIRVHANQLRVHLPIAHLADVRKHLATDEQADPDTADPAQLILTVPMRVRMRSGRTWIAGAIVSTTRPDPVLINALRQAHAMLARDASGMPVLDAAPPSPYRRRLIRLAFLAPELQIAILTGRQPAGLTLAGLMASQMSLSWDEQRLKFGATAAQ